MIASPSIAESFGSFEVLLATGPGGVGKTTSSAALAVDAARRGRRVLVLTIDPARRLADALGVTLDNTPKRVELAGLECSGELWALMLDPQATFDELIRRLAPQPAVAERLLNNLIYRQMSGSLAGTLEYTAVEKLYELRERHAFDLIVVDTPPSKSVLDFIHAPQWLLRFLDERVFKWFLMLEGGAESSGFAWGLLRRTGRIVRDVLGRVFGEQFIGELSEFMHAIESMTSEFRRRAEAIQRLLCSDAAGFLVVTTTESIAMADAVYLREQIEAHGIPFVGFIVNRVYRASSSESPKEVERLIMKYRPEERALADKIAGELRVLRAWSEHDTQAIAKLRERASWSGPVATFPRRVDAIHDLQALERLATAVRSV